MMPRSDFRMKSTSSLTGEQSGNSARVLSKASCSKEIVLKKDDLECTVQFFDIFSGKAVAFKADPVDPGDPHPVSGAGHDGEWRHILGQAGHSADIGKSADPGELMHPDETSQVGPVLHHDMAAQGGGVGHDHMIADPAIMGDMGIGHQHVVVTDHRNSAAFDTTAMDRNIFADQVMIADGQRGFLAAIAEILGSRADIGEGTDPVAGSRSPWAR